VPKSLRGAKASSFEQYIAAPCAPPEVVGAGTTSRFFLATVEYVETPSGYRKNWPFFKTKAIFLKQSIVGRRAGSGGLRK